MSKPKSLDLMAPKRRRMMDMILVLGGLKEESAIPPSRVSSELESLKGEIAPLINEVLAFPNAYFSELSSTIEKAGLLSQVVDRALLSQAVDKLEKAVASASNEGIVGLLELLRAAKNRLEGSEKEDVSQTRVDVGSVLVPLPEIVSGLEAIVGEYEAASVKEAEAAGSELTSLTSAVLDAVASLESDPDASLDAIQKIGTKTRYGPFLRTTAQVKRGVREGRIDGERFRELLSRNILTELRRGVIMFVLSKMGSKTVTQIADLTETSSTEIQAAIVSMIQRGEVEMVGLDGDAPVFAMVHESVPGTTLVLKRVIQQIRGITKVLEGPTKVKVNEPLQRLEQLLGRLQKLGQYDETAFAEDMNRLRDTADTATEAALSTSTDESSEDLRLLISAGLEAFARFRLKIALEKGPSLVTETNVYGEKLDPVVYEKMMSSYLDNEIERGTILILIRQLGAMTAEDLAKRTPIPQDRILQHLLRMKRDELLTLAGEKHGYVLFDVPRIPSEAEVAVKSASELALQLSEAKAELDVVLGDFKAEYIGRLANSLEAIAKARDRLEKITVDGATVGSSTLKAVEESARSAVVMAYRTRARLPSTRPKVTLEELQNVDVPSVLDEYRSQMGYAPLLGFGTINWEMSKCLGCKSCEISCPEDAIELKPVIELPKFFDFSEEAMGKLPVNKSLFYTTVRNLAVARPTENIALAKEAPGFGTVEVDLWLCVACRTCVRRCPGPEDGALELELKWNLPEVVRQITAETR